MSGKSDGTEITITPRADDEFIEKTVRALADFPLPSAGLTSNENYRRVLNWLHSGDVAAMIVGLSYGTGRKHGATLQGMLLEQGNRMWIVPFSAGAVTALMVGEALLLASMRAWWFQ